MNEQPDFITSPFDAICKTDEQGNEYWSARELGRVLGYTEYNKFKNAIRKAERACKDSGQAVLDHFAHLSELVEIGSGARRKVGDVHLSRQACYLTERSIYCGSFSPRGEDDPSRQGCPTKNEVSVSDHFVDADEMVSIGSKARRKISDVYLCFT